MPSDAFLDGTPCNGMPCDSTSHNLADSIDKTFYNTMFYVAL